MTIDEMQKQMAREAQAAAASNKSAKEILDIVQKWNRKISDYQEGGAACRSK
jgi:hypothetical protein